MCLGVEEGEESRVWGLGGWQGSGFRVGEVSAVRFQQGSGGAGFRGVYIFQGPGFQGSGGVHISGIRASGLRVSGLMFQGTGSRVSGGMYFRDQGSGLQGPGSGESVWLRPVCARTHRLAYT